MEWKRDPLLSKALEILNKEFNPIHIYLFGSRAQGTTRKDSDYDLVLVIPPTDEKRFDRQLKAHRLLSKINEASFDIFIYTQKEFNKWKGEFSSIPETALNTGKELHLG